MNYDVLEELCEPTLLTQLAGCVYQVSEIDNQAIHHINPDDQVSVRVVNHLYVQDQMSVDWNKNKDFKNLKLASNRWGNVWTYEQVNIEKLPKEKLKVYDELWAMF